MAGQDQDPDEGGSRGGGDGALEQAPALAESLGYLLERARRRVERSVASELETLGVEVRHLGVLLNVAHHGPLTQRQLGELLDIDRTTMVAVIDALEQQGLVVRRQNPSDRRAWLITLTDRGRTTQEWAARMQRASEARALEGLTERQRAELRRMLQKI